MTSLLQAVVCGCIAITLTPARAVEPSPDNKLPVLKPKEIRHINPKWTGASGVTFSPDGKRVVAVANGGYGPNGIFAVWDIETGEKVLEVNAMAGEKRMGSLVSVAYSPDGKVIATGGSRGWTNPEDRGKAAVTLWDAQTGKQIRMIESRQPQQAYSMAYSVAFSPDGKRIVSGGGNTFNGRQPHEQFLTVWDAETGKELLDLKGLKAVVSCATFSGDGKRIVSTDSGNSSRHSVRLWDAGTGKELLKLQGSDKAVFSCVALNHDGTRIVTGGPGKAVRLWDADTGKELRAIDTEPVACVAFHPNGKWVVGVGRDGKNLACVVQVWDIATGRAVVTFEAHNYFPTRLAISADGKRIAICFDDGRVSVWSFNAEQ